MRPWLQVGFLLVLGVLVALGGSLVQHSASAAPAWTHAHQDGHAGGSGNDACEFAVETCHTVLALAQATASNLHFAESRSALPAHGRIASGLALDVPTGPPRI